MIEAIISRVSTGHILSSVKISLFAMSILFQAKASFNWSNSWSLLAARKRVDIIIHSSFKPLLDENVFTCVDPQNFSRVGKREKNCFQGVQKLFWVIYYENFISLHFSKGGGWHPGFLNLCMVQVKCAYLWVGFWEWQRQSPVFCDSRTRWPVLSRRHTPVGCSSTPPHYYSPTFSLSPSSVCWVWCCRWRNATLI